MEKSILEQAENILDIYKVKDCSQLETFLEISELNRKLEKSGLSNPRGYNILTTEEIYNQKNVNFSQSLLKKNIGF